MARHEAQPEGSASGKRTQLTMEHELITLGILFFFAIVGGIIATRFRQPAVIGLLLVGALIGPNALNLVRDENMVHMMAEFGAMLLLFVIGLEFVIPKIMKIGFKALLLGFLKFGIAFFITYEISIWLGQSRAVSMVLGAMIAISSTVVIVKILESKGLYKREEVPILIGILLVEDLISIVVLTFLASAQGSMTVMAGLEQLVVAVTVMLVAYLVMLRAVKMSMDWIMRNSGEEVITFIALGILAGFCCLAHWLHLSPEIGAFLAGSIVANLKEVKLFEHAIMPYSLTFTSLFFISVGTMVNFSSIMDNLPLITVLVLLAVVAPFVSVGIISYLFANFSREQTIFSSLVFISIGEFSLLIAQAAVKLDLGIDLVSIASFIIFITAIIMSLSVGYYSKVTDLLEKRTPSNWYAKPRSLARYIKMLFDELDIDNSRTLRFKKQLFAAISYTLFAVFMVIVWRRIYTFLQDMPHGTMAFYAANLAFIIAITCFAYKVYRQLEGMHYNLVAIIANANSSDFASSKRILNSLLSVMAIIGLICIAPILIVFMQLPAWANAVPYVLMVVLFFKFRRTLAKVHDYSKRPAEFPHYRKVCLKDYGPSQDKEPVPE